MLVSRLLSEPRPFGGEEPCLECGPDDADCMAVSLRNAHAAMYIGWLVAISKKAKSIMNQSYLVKGLPKPAFASASSAKASMSAIVFAEDMESSWLFGSSC